MENNMQFFCSQFLIVTSVLTSSLMFNAASAGEADVLNVQATCNKLYQCTFNVQLKHDDQGWQHYANKWEVLSLNGDVLATRTLAHPHVKEQPFTRSLIDVPIPQEVKTVIVRAHDSIHGYGGKGITVTLSSDSTPLN